MSGPLADADLALAEREVASLLRKCEAVLRDTKLSPGRQTLMTNRVAALQTALVLVTRERSRTADTGSSS